MRTKYITAIFSLYTPNPLLREIMRFSATRSPESDLYYSNCYVSIGNACSQGMIRDSSLKLTPTGWAQKARWLREQAVRKASSKTAWYLQRSAPQKQETATSAALTTLVRPYSRLFLLEKALFADLFYQLFTSPFACGCEKVINGNFAKNDCIERI